MNESNDAVICVQSVLLSHGLISAQFHATLPSLYIHVVEFALWKIVLLDDSAKKLRLLSSTEMKLFFSQVCKWLFANH